MIKRALITLILIFFFCLSLIYHGVFRDGTNPLDLARYFFSVLKNKEWFLTYQVYNHKLFPEAKMRGFYVNYQLHALNRVELFLSQTKDNSASVRAKLFYKNILPVFVTMELEKSGKKWVIRDIN